MEQTVQPTSSSGAEVIAQTEHAVAQLLDGLASLDLTDLCGTRDQLGRARALLEDAVATLNENFASLSEDTDHQREQVSSLINDMSGELRSQGESQSVNLKSFVDQTSRLLTSFADLVAHFSKQSVGIAYKIDDMAEQMTEIFQLVERVDAIAEDTNILAINAALEAVRAGEKGKGFGVVASEVRVLSRKTKSLNDTIVERMKDAESSIMAVREAVGTMASHDMSMALDAKADLDTVMAKLDSMQSNVESTLAQIETFTGRVAHNASEAIRGLQFEDLVTQVLQNVDERFERVSSAMTAIRDAADDGGASAEERLARIRAAVDEYGAACAHARKPAVQQDSMDEGEVTFF
jgi:methyl-accepting chemotaxis protein